MTTQSIRKLNNLVISVVKENTESENFEDVWMSKSIQKQVKTLVMPKSSKFERVKKDPNAPKRGKSAYLFFCSDYRDKVKAELGEESKATDVTRELGLRWNALKDSKKASDKKSLAEYERAAAEDKSRYDSEKAEYVSPEDFDDGAPRRRGGKKTVNIGPKRAKSAYLYFCSDYRDKVRSENPTFQATKITSELGRLWNLLKEDKSRKEELDMYEARALEDKNRYDLEKNNVDKNSVNKLNRVLISKETVLENDLEDDEELVEENEDNNQTSAQHTNESLVKKEKKSGKSSLSSANNGYQAYCAAHRSELKAQHPKSKAADITKMLSKQWKKLSEEDKQTWKDSTTL